MGYTSFPVKENLGHKYGYQSDERNLKMSAPLHISRNIVTEVPLKAQLHLISAQKRMNFRQLSILQNLFGNEEISKFQVAWSKVGCVRQELRLCGLRQNLQVRDFLQEPSCRRTLHLTEAL